MGRQDHAVKVVLTPTDDGWLQVTDWRREGDDAESDAEPPSGVRGWLDRKSREIHDSLAGAETGVRGRLRRLWEWLHRHVHPDEALLRRLRSSETITLRHPTTVTPDKARIVWHDFLARRRRHHLIWLGIDALASPLTIILAPLPGPNVVGYWFVYRSACHALALLGIHRARGGHATVACEPTAELPDAQGVGGADPGPRPPTESDESTGAR
jgi:hypothetical protein